jgi:hypothetical protein
MVPPFPRISPAFLSPATLTQLQAGFSIRGSFYEGFVHGELQECAQSYLSSIHAILSGQATVLRKDGKVYDGEFKFGLCHGQVSSNCARLY